MVDFRPFFPKKVDSFFGCYLLDIFSISSAKKGVWKKVGFWENIMCEKNKKRAILAYHPECLHNGIILIVYILQICWCKGTVFCWNNKIFSHKFVDIMYFLYFCSRIVHWHPNKTTGGGVSAPNIRLCIAYKSIFEILIKQRRETKWSFNTSCVLHTKVSLTS